LDVRIEARPGQAVEGGRTTPARAGLRRDPHLSGRHFSGVCEGQQCHVGGLGRTNGAYVKGARIGAPGLPEGDRIDAGNCTFVVRIHRDTERLPDPVSLVAAPFCSVTSNTRFPFAMHRWEDPHGKARLSVVVKATFTISSRPQAP